MPSSILNLKFKGNKSFVAFSNLGDSDSLTKTWKVCSKVASYLEQGQRLENLSWRLWHLQNLMVESDNARSKREFKKLSKCMSDKLDKEKGRSIEELEAPGFKRNQSTDKIRLRAEEKERNREANQNARPGTIKRMQFTFSVDKPATVSAAIQVDKPDLKPSQQFKDTLMRRGRPTTRSSSSQNTTTATSAQAVEAYDKKPPSLMETDRQPSPPPTHFNDTSQIDSDNDMQWESIQAMHAQHQSWNDESASLRFPSIFANDFGPLALLYPPPSLSASLSYGEGMSRRGTMGDGFSINRPTIELPLDELLNDLNTTDSPSAWSSATASVDNAGTQYGCGAPDDSEPMSVPEAQPSLPNTRSTRTTSSVPAVPPMSQAAREVLPTTIHPSQVAASSWAQTSPTMSSRPTLSVKTSTSSSMTTRSGAPSATAMSSMNPSVLNGNNSAPGGVKAECSNCGATHTPLWRRGLNDELNCNACGLYCKLHKRPRPKSMRNSHGEGRTQSTPRQDSVDVMGEPAQCYNCHTMATPLWRKDDEGKTVCNACGLYFKLHGSARPISMKSDVIRKRSRHDARRATNGEPPTASPGASRRPSPAATHQPHPSPTLAPDTQMNYNYQEDFEFTSTPPLQQSELMGALGTDSNDHSNYNSQGTYESSLAYSSYPGPYHPDYLKSSDIFPYASGDTSADASGGEGVGTDDRSNKRRRMSNDSLSEPPSSSTSASYSSYDQSSVTTQSQRSSFEFPYSSNYGSYGAGTMRGSSQNAFWHPPMLPQDKSPQSFWHPPMLPQEDLSHRFVHPPMLVSSEESPMDFLHPPMLPQEEADQLFATYLHRPMVTDSPMTQTGALYPHPPMFPNENNIYTNKVAQGHGHNQELNDYYESGMQSYERNYGSGN